MSGLKVQQGLIKGLTCWHQYVIIIRVDLHRIFKQNLLLVEH